MRKVHALDALLPRLRQAVLATVLLQPEKRWFASELVRRLGASQAGLHRELQRLTQAGVLLRQEEGKHVYYRANPACPFLIDLRRLLAKTAGLVEVVRSELAPFADRIRVSFVYGSIARGEELATSDVDLMVVGHVGLKDIAGAVRRLTELLGRPVSPVVLPENELRRKVLEKHHFMREVLDAPKLFVIGGESELDSIARGQPSRETGRLDRMLDTSARRAAREEASLHRNHDPQLLLREALRPGNGVAP